MNKLLKKLLNFHRFQQKGIILLSVVIMVTVFTRIFLVYYENWNYSQININIEEAENIFLDQDTATMAVSPSELVNFPVADAPEVTLFFFDPNTATEHEWERLGLSQQQVKVISNYKSKGGKFREKEDLKKMYSISNEIYEKMEPYIVIAPERQRVRREASSFVHSRTERIFNYAPIDINTADSTELKKLKGVGSYYASAIIKYRNLLGGYVNKDQLMEVYRMSDSLYSIIEPQVFIQLNNLRKLNINTIDFNTLQKHPYISNAVARSILTYREQHGMYKSVDDLKNLVVLSRDEFERLLPYLSVD